MKRALWTIIGLISISTNLALAESEQKFSTLGTYFGIAQGWMEIEENNLNNDFQLYTFDLIGGATFHPNMGIEARLGFGGTDTSGSKSYSLDHYFSFYFKPQYTLGRLNTYALVGPSFVSSETSQLYCGRTCVQSKDKYTEFSLSYGAGAIYYFDWIMVGLEYVKVLDKDRVDIDRGGLLLGFVF
ncbi:porin family protein [Alkalimarinus alittae]|uniref:Porin family protein n=1 Tax=Alkalimarinus alittae TaxID=2961619 RepID=A0ABY6MZY8_9ALTE|nr:porin family protein [Alkalimarinus alittae]UZE95398.1 porin family protein [Alkalimarinus alittae]